MLYQAPSMRKELEVFGFGVVEVVLDEAVDAAPRGPWRRLARSSARSAGGAGGDDFDVAVFGVADPAAEVEFAGLAVTNQRKPTPCTRP